MREKFQEIISRYIPFSAVDYCTLLWEKYPFSFKVSRARKSKLGDYRYNIIKNRHEVSVNGNLNKYAFLITFLHELAHLTHFNNHKNNRSPHGSLWKNEFRSLMEPMLKYEIFPPDLLSVLSKHMQNPKASSQSDLRLVRVLRIYDTEKIQSQEYLENINVGSRFELNGKIFKKLSIKRTRAVCLEEKTRRKYLIPQIAEVTGL